MVGCWNSGLYCIVRSSLDRAARLGLYLMSFIIKVQPCRNSAYLKVRIIHHRRAEVMSLEVGEEFSSFASRTKKVNQGKWTNAEKYVVVYPRDARFVDELTVRPGDVIVVEEKGDSPWWLGKTRDGASGYFYRPFCKELVVIKCDYKTALMQFDGRGLHKVVYKETSYFAEEKPGDDLECLICRNLASEPHQSGCCGHTMCYSCAVKWQRQKNSCPHCCESPLDLVKDPRTKRLITSLTLHCTHYKNGCSWKGSINNVSDHLQTECPYEEIDCDNKECGEKVQRRNFEDHMKNDCRMRLIECLCGQNTAAEEDLLSKKFTYNELVSDHYKHCPSWPMRCPNHCCAEEKLMRSTLQDHIDNNCPEQVISCQLVEAGCTVRVKRKEMDEHIQSKHLLNLSNNYTKVKDENCTLHIRNRELEEAFAALQSAYNSLKKDHDNLESQYACQTADKLDLQGHYSHQMDLNTALEKKYSHLIQSERANREIVDRQYARLVTEKSKLEKRLAEETAMRRSLNRKHADLSVDKAALEEQIKDLQGRCDCLIAEKVALEEQITVQGQCDCLTAAEKVALKDLCERHLRAKTILEGQISNYVTTIIILIVLLFAALIM